MKITEKIAERSSKFYELIPDLSFRKQPVAMLDRPRNLYEKFRTVDSLLDFEVSSKILLGALYNLKKINPMDYCFNALGVKLLPLQSDSKEYNLILPYISNGYSNYAKGFVQNIFALERRDEADRLSHFKNQKNRMYLWHGSRASNMMGILNQGLRIAPAEAERSGASLGSGIYFADVFGKSLTYTDDKAAQNQRTRSSFVLLCEVALGDPYEVYEQKDIEEMDGKSSFYSRAVKNVFRPL